MGRHSTGDWEGQCERCGVNVFTNYKLGIWRPEAFGIEYDNMCRPYWPHGDRGNRPNLLQYNGFGPSVYMIHSPRMPTVAVSVVMYYYPPRLLAKSNIEKQYTSHCVNDVCNGSPSRIRSVLRISLGITIRPRSSTRRTMPVAFMLSSPLKAPKRGFVR